MGLSMGLRVRCSLCHLSVANFDNAQMWSMMLASLSPEGKYPPWLLSQIYTYARIRCEKKVLRRGKMRCHVADKILREKCPGRTWLLYLQNIFCNFFLEKKCIVWKSYFIILFHAQWFKNTKNMLIWSVSSQFTIKVNKVVDLIYCIASQ